MKRDELFGAIRTWSDNNRKGFDVYRHKGMKAMKNQNSVGTASSEKKDRVSPIDRTPAEQDYTPGLGDRMDAISYTIGIGWYGLAEGANITTTYEQALEIQKKVGNITNGAHQICYLLGQDILRWGTSPYLIEDTNEPMGDGTPGSGHRKYRKFVDDSVKNDAVVAQILEPLLAGVKRDNYGTAEDRIPLSCYTHTEDGQKKVGWSMGGEDWHLLSLYNLYESGYAQKAWRRMMDQWNFRTHLYYDAMIPVPEGHYDTRNRTTKYGGILTTTEMEWDAVQREIRYSWENFAISSGEEYIHPKYKGLSVYFTGPYGTVTNDDYLNLWGNSVVICGRGSHSMNMTWGSEDSSSVDAFQFNHSMQPWDAFIVRMMEHNLQYLYMLERKPLSYKEDDDIHQVTFSGNLVSTYYKKTGSYTLVENGDFIIADGGDRFIPQVGAGCRIYVYSRDGKKRAWKLPAAWDGISEADEYLLTVEKGAIRICTLPIADGLVTVEPETGKPYLIVPKGMPARPETATFNDLKNGDTPGAYQRLRFDPADAFRVYGASARGGFGSPSIHVDSDEKYADVRIAVESGTILHSLKVGNKGGSGKVVLHSSDPRNPDVMLRLPGTDRVCKFNTMWKYGESDAVGITIENSEAVGNVLFDSVMYTPPADIG